MFSVKGDLDMKTFLIAAGLFAASLGMAEAGSGPSGGKGGPKCHSFFQKCGGGGGGNHPGGGYNTPSVPLPAAGFLLVGGLGAFALVRRRNA